MTRRLFPELAAGLEALPDAALGVGYSYGTVNGSGNGDAEASAVSNAVGGGAGAGAAGQRAAVTQREVCVRAGSGWKHVLASLQAQAQTNGKGKFGNGKANGNGNGMGAGVDELTAELAARREDVTALWEDAGVQSVLRRRGVRLQDMPGL